jgi:CrcB protein
VATGGAVGSALRYLVSGWAQRLLPHGTAALPLGTLFVNVTGSLLIGILAGLAGARGVPGPEFRLLLVTGLLGGYTTFSAFSLEHLVLLRAGNVTVALASAVLQVLLGLAAAWVGFLLTGGAGRPA